MEMLSTVKCFGGEQRRYRHRSDVLDCDMTVSVYLPPQAEHGPVPVVWFLAGLTCNDENFVIKAGAQRYAAELGLAIICPDTSPRGLEVANDDAYDLGQGAGFYLNATQAPWAKHFRMWDYITAELPGLLGEACPLDMQRQSIMGHSMGGHGALTIGLTYPQRFAAISAFAPIVAPMQVPWGVKALTAYLGAEPSSWAAHDACEILRTNEAALPPILIDQGEADNFLAEQLRPELLEAQINGRDITVRRQAGYDHSYFFIASFVGEHLAWHRKQFDQ
jgi:S-formylglutathione hydrolase